MQPRRSQTVWNHSRLLTCLNATDSSKPSDPSSVLCLGVSLLSSALALGLAYPGVSPNSSLSQPPLIANFQFSILPHSPPFTPCASPPSECSSICSLQFAIRSTQP